MIKEWKDVTYARIQASWWYLYRIYFLFSHTDIWIIYMSADYAHQNFILLWHLTWLAAFSCGFRSSLEKSCHTWKSQPDLIFCSNIRARVTTQLSTGHLIQNSAPYRNEYEVLLKRKPPNCNFVSCSIFFIPPTLRRYGKHRY